jgi:hypothetical protein
MKFLVTARNKDAYYALPPEKRIELMQGAVALIEKNQKAGKCKEVYFLGDLKGSVVIWEVSSDEEVTRDLIENPMWPYTDYKIRPLIEWGPALKIITKYRQQRVRK